MGFNLLCFCWHYLVLLLLIGGPGDGYLWLCRTCPVALLMLRLPQVVLEYCCCYRRYARLWFGRAVLLLRFLSDAASVPWLCGSCFMFHGHCGDTGCDCSCPSRQ
ncbi:hypothetical protein Nepgr_005229 [Nepenthes gracilis]|uniref:Secreted protein n=1 Tax=Nepenthes gracilis TaxID=150966 RepID=A0AAD3XG59_NEPGR|nr:hypothetical protein Nepgr_005229 [Nepenthes gracilis]